MSPASPSRGAGLRVTGDAHGRRPVAAIADLRHYAKHERDTSAVDSAVSRRAATRRACACTFRAALSGSGVGGDHCRGRAHCRGRSAFRLVLLLLGR
jgi:hypothetical protein